jgi:hypothetical protein
MMCILKFWLWEPCGKILMMKARNIWEDNIKTGLEERSHGDADQH